MALFQKRKITNCLGVDIGTTSVKIVELSRSGNVDKLENYGEIAAGGFNLDFSKKGDGKDNIVLTSSAKEIAKAISILIKEAGFRTRKAVFSVPDFCTFFTSFDLPPMNKKEIPQAVKFQASKYVPFPLTEMKIDWAIIEGRPASKSFLGKKIEGTKLKILLVTVPNEIITNYEEIAKMARLEVLFLEAEVFSLVRSLIGNEKGVIILVDIGGRSTTCNVIENGILKSSHSFDVSGNEFTHAIARSLNVDYEEADRLKKEIGIRKGTKEEEILYPLLDVLLREVRKLSTSNVSKVILAGGTALIPGLPEYFTEQLGVVTEIANPFLKIKHPSSLKKILEEMAPSYGIATGLALKGLEEVL